MHAGFYTDPIFRHGAAADRRDQARRRAAGPVLRGVLSLGRRLIQGRDDETLTDHLLDDIGLSRSDVAALTL